MSVLRNFHTITPCWIEQWWMVMLIMHLLHQMPDVRLTLAAAKNWWEGLILQYSDGHS